MKTLVEAGAGGVSAPMPFHLKGFYFMAFMNLFLVVAVLFIIAMWRWW